MLLTLAEMGPTGDKSQARPIPGDRRVRCLRQLHLPLRQDPAVYRSGIAGLPQPQAERRVRRLMRYHEPTQPDPDLRHQHYLQRANCAGQAAFQGQ